MWIELEDVHQTYDGAPVLRGITLRLEKGTIGCLLGPSGSGKTSVLRCIAGFEPLQGGVIRADGVVLSRAGYSLPPEQRQVGMVFQDYALLPHLTVSENVRFGLHALPRAARRARTLEVLELVGLADVAQSYPRELSGGQQQRVALARSLAPRPRLLLLDEPFSSLDVELRQRLSGELREILKEVETTALLVTHDQTEAFAMADVVGVMRHGQLEQWDTPYNLYHAPATRFVAEFVGQGVFLPGRIDDDGKVRIEMGSLEGRLVQRLPPATSVDVLLRPDDIVHDAASPLTARVCAKCFRGSDILYTLCLPSGSHLLAAMASHFNHAVGEHIGVRLATEHVVVFPRQH